jgi:RNA polymerase sigma factor (sigma-70 family)
MGWVDEERAYAEHRGDLVRFATALVGPSHAEDLLSNTLTALLESGRWAQADDMRAYAMRAVALQAASWHRGTSRRVAREQRAARLDSGNIPAPAFDNRAFDNRAFNNTAFDDPELWALVLALPVRQRAVLYLTYWEDQTVGSVAGTLGLSDGAVRRHLARARATLRRKLS